MRRRAIVVVALAMLSALTVAAAPALAGSSDDYTYRITIENLTGNQSITPAVAATHDATYKLFRPGWAASHGVQQLAENGGVPVLAEEALNASGVADVAVVGDAPIAPGSAATTLVSTDAHHRRLSLAAMLICTNDGFTGTAIGLPGAVGAERTYYANSYDAGTEINTESYADLVPPCDGLGASGETNPALAENGVIHRHQGIAGVADLTAADHGWTDPTIRITVERVYTYTVTVTNLTSGQPVTPTVFATHSGYSGIFSAGEAASSGLQQLAENGGVPVLVAELEAKPGIGTIAVAGDAPIPPGESASVDVVVDDGYRLASLAGMLVCTNDGFGGIDSLRLPGWIGQQVHVYGNAYDAGTEINTEAYPDLVPPCDGSGGSGMTNPALAEGGVVGMHSGILGVADLDPSIHGWDGPVIGVTIERTG